MTNDEELTAAIVAAANEGVISPAERDEALHAAKEVHALPPQPESPERDDDIRRRLPEMKFGEKIKLALLGSSVIRGLLIRDPNRLVQLTVLKNPRLTEGEVEEFARNTNLSDAVIRAIADSKVWMKSYKVKLNVVSNGRTPRDVALKWLKFLNASDLKNIARSKSVPSIVATSARKMISDKAG